LFCSNRAFRVLRSSSFCLAVMAAFDLVFMAAKDSEVRCSHKSQRCGSSNYSWR
jgi:hypothetical protein